MEKYFDINEQGYSVRCKIYYTDLHAIDRVVIFGHGFGGHKDNKAAAKFADRLITKYKGFAVVTFDWPCHGMDARKKMVLAECVEYLDIVTGYVKKQYNTDRLYMYSTSFGGYMTLHYIAEKGNPFVKIALRCPAIRMNRVIKGTLLGQGDMEKLEKGKEVLVGFDRKVKVGMDFIHELDAADITKEDFMDYADDILIIHGQKDEVVPYADSEEFADNNVIELIPVEKADHRFMDPKMMDFAITKIIEFFA